MPHRILDYAQELLSIRDSYVTATLSQRLEIIRQRLSTQDSGPNRLVTAVSAVEALARSLAMHRRAKSKDELRKLYSKYKDKSPKTLVQECLTDRDIAEPAQFFQDDNWRLFCYAVDYRNLLAHECTYLGQDKYPSLIAACEEVLERLVQLAGIREKRT